MMLDEIDKNSQDELAIIGLSGRFPGAKNLEEFWTNLIEGVESITVFSDADKKELGHYSSWLQEPGYVNADGFLEDVDLFDASFFGFSHRQAQLTGPEQRLFLECAVEALENAGYVSDNYEGSIGVFAGSNPSHYLEYTGYNQQVRPSMSGVETLLGNDLNYLATQISYQLNLKGPSMMVQTACSTGLVAIHVASQSLLNGECDIALAGAVTVKVPPKTGYFYQEGGIFSPDGHCRAFDVNSQGTVPGSGIGIVVLKPLSAALADGDRIHAVIKGSAINNDGAVKVGYTAPSLDGQAAVVSEALEMAEVDPRTISYIEAHGTGTALGDPIEIAALTEVFRTQTSDRGFCAIGSVKTNVGHLGVAAGMPGIIKVILALKHQLIPPSLHYEKPNPKIDFANSPFYVNDRLTEWKTDGQPRRAGISSLGIGGTNVHIILEEPPLAKPSDVARPWQLLVLSAKSSSALETATANLANTLKQYPDVNLADVAYTLQIGRRGFEYRRMLVASDLEDAVEALSPTEVERVFTRYQEPGDRPIAFMFSGQGAQYANMGRELYQRESTFREWVDRGSEILKPYLGLDLRQILYSDDEENQRQLQQTAITQPALFVIEYALAQLWMEWGVHPAAAIGHSIGEYVAATLAGVFSLEDALALVAERGRLMQELPSGAMLAVSLTEGDVRQLLDETLSLAAINAPSSCVVSGPTDAINTLEEKLTSQAVKCRRLRTSHAFHSQMMDSILESFHQCVARVRLHAPKLPYISNVTGTWITSDRATDPNYWTEHLRQTVRFAEGVQLLLQNPSQILLEIGPGRTLSELARQHPDKQPEQMVVTSIRHPQETRSDVEFLLNAVGQLWLAGVPVDWSGFHNHQQRHRLPLPTYPFERQRYWLDPVQSEPNAKGTQVDKKLEVADWFYLPFWKPSVPPVSLEKNPSSRTLVFVDETGLGSQLATRWEQLGREIITVEMGSEFAKKGDRLFTLNPAQLDSYEALFSELATQKFQPEHIVHLWSLTSGAGDRDRENGFYSLLFIAQAIERQDWDKRQPIQISVIINNVQSVTGEEPLSPEKAMLLGAVTVIPQEYLQISTRSIDVILPPQASWQESKLIEQLEKELLGFSSEVAVAYRGQQRWVQAFEPVRLENTIAETTRLKPEGVYLITGGLGGIGFILARHLAKTVRAKLILTGRSVLPERETWSEWLRDGSNSDRVSRKISKVLELEELGAEVLVVSADVASLEQMQTVINRAEERFGSICGVIHAAGLPRQLESINQLDETACERQFQTKVEGVLVLSDVLKAKALDFCLVLSSLSSVLGGLGHSAYAAGNLFADCFIRQQNQTNFSSWITVNWDSWQLATEDRLPLSIGTNLLENAILPAEGIKAFEQILAADLQPQIVVSTVGLQPRIDRWVRQTLVNPSNLEKTASGLSLYSRPNLPNAYVAPRTETEQTLVTIWQEFLSVKQIGVTDNFFDLGGHSLMATQVIASVRESFNLELPLQSLFENPTVARIANLIETLDRLGQKLQPSEDDLSAEREVIEL